MLEKHNNTNTKEYENKIVRRFEIGKKILYFVGAAFAVICFPDVVYTIRVFLAQIPLLSQLLQPNQEKLTIDVYIPIVLTIVSCLVTASLSLAAHNLSRTLAKIQMDGEKAKQSLWATRVLDCLKSNMRVAYNAHDGTGSLRDFEFCSTYQEDIINLHTAKLIDLHEREYLEECMKSLLTIHKQHQSGNDEKAATLNGNFVLKYLGCADFSFSQETKTVIDNLDKISKGGH